MSPDPKGFQAIVQEWPVSSGQPPCVGFTNLSISRPTRVLVASDYEATLVRDRVVERLSWLLARSGHAAACDGPGDFGCWATEDAAARNILLYVAGAKAPSASVERLVAQWLARGLEALALVRGDASPDLVLPPQLRSLNAFVWRAHPDEVLGELLDTILLDVADRRVFISYARVDGSPLAERVFDVLERRRFEVFLDRFRLPPGSDFLERIQDEILDKSMVVVIETPQALESHWVRHEVGVAVARRLGLAAVNIGGRPGIREIDEPARCRIDDDQHIARFLVDQHTKQLLSRRESLRQSVHQALRHAGLPTGAISELPGGYLVAAPGGRRAVGVSTRPADVHRFRLAAELAGAGEAYLVHPRPSRESRRRDLGWLSGVSTVIEVDEGRIDGAAAAIAR